MNKYIHYGLLMLSASISAVLYASTQLQAQNGVIQLKSATELSSCLTSGKIVVLLFSSLTCGPCQAFHPIYQQLAQENTDVLFLEAVYGKTGGSDQLLNKYGIRAFPSFVIFDANGNKINNMITGANDNTKSKILGEIAVLRSGTSKPIAQEPVASQVQPQAGPIKSVSIPVQHMSTQPMAAQNIAVKQVPMQKPVSMQKPVMQRKPVACAPTQPMLGKKRTQKQKRTRRPRQQVRVRQ